MESLSRPPHSRKHSATNVLSFKNPYDGVLLSSNGGKGNSFEGHEYAEIFSGSSSIPVLDLSGLDERVGSGDCRSSKLDYSNIFGGFGNDDVAVPYEELFNGSAKKILEPDLWACEFTAVLLIVLINSCLPPVIVNEGVERSVSVHWIPANTWSPLQESGSLHSSRKTKRSSSEVSDQSIDGVKQQFNMSFNRTSQRNNDASNGKIHIAELHAVPGFTCFVDGAPQLQKIEGHRPVPSLKREVSRTWSFSAELEAFKGKGGSSCDRSHVPDKRCDRSHVPEKPHNVNEVNLESHFSEASAPSSRPSNLSANKDPRRLSSFASKEDASGKIGAECSPPFLDEEFDENSTAAVSAAALKKAIEQAQESIRIAKMVMDRKKEGRPDGSKPRPKGRRKVLDKEIKINHKVCSKENNARVKYKDLDPIFSLFTGIDGKYTLSMSHNDTLSDARDAQVERVWENVEAAKGHGEAHVGGGKLIASNCSQSETLCMDEQFGKLRQNVDAAEARRKATDVPDSAANAECRTAHLASGQVGGNKSLLLGKSKLASNPMEVEARKETLQQRQVTIHHATGPEVVAELAERTINTCQRMQPLEKSVDEAQCQATFNHAEGPENTVEMMDRVLNTSQGTREPEKVVVEAGENVRICQEYEMMEKRESDTDDKGRCDEKVNVEQLTVLSPAFNNFLNEAHNLVKNDAPEQEEMEKKSDDVSEWKENGDRHGRTYEEEENGIRQKEYHLWFESEEQLKEAWEEETGEGQINVFPEIEEVEKKVNEALELEGSNKKQSHSYDGDEPKLLGELEQNKGEERHMNASEYEAAETTINDSEAETTNNCAEVQEPAVFWDAEESINTLGGAGISEENHYKCEFHEAAYEEDIDEAVDANSGDGSTVFNDAHAIDTRTIFSETPADCDCDLGNKAEEYHKAVGSYLENDTVPGVTETISAIDKEEAAQLFHLEGNEVPGMDSLHRSASEEIFVESKIYNAFEVFSSVGKAENIDVMVGYTGEKLPEEDTLKTSSEIHGAAQEYAAKSYGENLPEVHSSDNRTGEFDFMGLRQVLEQTPNDDEGSVSISSLENKDGLSAHESKECAVNVKDNTPNKEEAKDEEEMVLDERKHAEEQSEVLYSQLHSGEIKEMEKSMETERALETGLNMEMHKENLVGTTAMEAKHAREVLQNFERNGYQQRIEAIKREREREKDRVAVERAIREARERAFVEARERAERAAVERAAAEVRQRVLAETREKLEKASVGKQPADKASTEAKLRAERAAVERATAEARERALEKAKSQKTSTEARTQADRYPTERFSTASRNYGLKHSFSSSDLENGTNTVSAQRRKARLERHQRIMERAAKALAEKNMRDLLAQKEQAERNRLAESLDADIKRWATGKERNLRALLSTLQYILGPDSGWQPISLTEIITTAAVKKAYRKATLYVHPDKVQQRGATIQQKYICEKVFDLLKAAWNRFNSEERPIYDICGADIVSSYLLGQATYLYPDHHVCKAITTSDWSSLGETDCHSQRRTSQNSESMALPLFIITSFFPNPSTPLKNLHRQPPPPPEPPPWFSLKRLSWFFEMSWASTQYDIEIKRSMYSLKDDKPIERHVETHFFNDTKFLSALKAKPRRASCLSWSEAPKDMGDIPQKRVLVEAQEKLEKASVVKQSADKASTEAKLRAE
ncbi:Auxilin-like protein 1 [Sesamum angolense]|uniref:Auxilin-like protein 1 n=1 Tax=Sesamum angolense TaxID=2727404 RepID=A0AAE1WC83_9LAMI|nr:Auxilin-like protein 1 [Sesamum angolense]